jgi:hypothetical protein
VGFIKALAVEASDTEVAKTLESDRNLTFAGAVAISIAGHSWGGCNRGPASEMAAEARSSRGGTGASLHRTIETGSTSVLLKDE